MQTETPAQPLVAPQQTASPTVDQTMMPNQGIQAASSGTTAEMANAAVIQPKIPTPYHGIIPPRRLQSQSSQLGMLHKFVARSPLAPVASTQNRVVKNSAPKPAVRPQVPVSPVSPPSATSAESGFSSEMSAEIEALFQDPGDEIASPVTLKPCGLTLPMVENNDTAVNSLMAEADNQTFVNEYPEFMNYESYAAAAGERSVDASESNEQPAVEQPTMEQPAMEQPAHGITQDLAHNVEQAEIPPHLRVATPAEIDAMTFEQQYLYGIRQGLPNKGYPINKAPKLVAAKPVIKEPESFIIIDDPPAEEELWTAAYEYDLGRC